MRRAFDGTAAGIGNGLADRYGHRGGIYGRYPCRAADCGRHLVFCCRKGLKSPFSFRLAIVQRIERMPPKRKIQVRFLLARFDGLHLSVSRVAGSFRYKAFQCWRAFLPSENFFFLLEKPTFRTAES